MSQQKRPEAVRWGCRVHQTPRGIPCQHCGDQRVLFPRTAARRDRRKPPPTETRR
jgi:DNA-directed RNA polymerase subunit RPC12/RpoP